MKKIPYCPNPECSFNKDVSRKVKWFRKKGFTETKLNGKVQRYQCTECHRTFSLNYYTIDHYVHKKIKYTALLRQISTSSGIRDMARNHRCSPGLILNRIQRLSQKISAVCSREIQDLELIENVAADGLESFVLSQFFPTNINILVGKESQFIYYFNSFHFKRKGRSTERQKRKKEKLYKTAQFEKRATSNRFMDLLNFLAQKAEKSSKKNFILDTDEHKVYLTQFNKHPLIKKKVTHRRTNSRIERNYQNNLFACNYIDRQIRKDQAEHARETVQFCRSMNHSMDRFTCYSFWHNFIKPFRVNKTKSIYNRHAEVAGFSREKIKDIVSEIFEGSIMPLFQIFEYLNSFQKLHWNREILNPMHISMV